MLSYAMLYNKHNVVLCLSYVVEHMFVMLYVIFVICYFHVIFVIYHVLLCYITCYFMLRYITCYVMFLM